MCIIRKKAIIKQQVDYNRSSINSKISSLWSNDLPAPPCILTMSFNDTEAVNNVAVNFTNALLAALTILGSLTNAVLFACLVSNPLGCFRNSSSYLVANQAFSDCLTSSAMAVYYVLKFCYPSIRQASREFRRTLLVLTFQGFVALFIVSLDRFLAIRFPIRYRIYVKSSMSFGLILATWSSTLLTILLNIFATNLFNSVRTALMSIGALLVFIKVCLHCLAFWTMKKKSAEIRRKLRSNGQNAQLAALRRESRFLLTVCIITVVVIVTTVPYLIYFKFNGLSWSFSGTPATTVLTLYLLGLSIGPSIYYIRLDNYYQTLKLIVCKLGSC